MLKLLLIPAVLIIVHVSLMAQPVSPYTEKDIPALLRQLKKSNPDTGKVELLLSLSRYYVWKKKEDAGDLDSSLLFAKQAELLSQDLNYNAGSGRSYQVSSMALRERGAFEPGKYSANKAVEIFTKINDQQDLADTYLELYLYYSASGKDLQEKIRLLQLALASFHLAGNIFKEADCYKELGDLHQVQGNFSQSLADLKQALKLYQMTNYQRLMGVYDLLGFVSASLGDQNEGIRYGLLAVETAERLNDSTAQLCTIYNRLGITYFNANELSKAGIYFQKSLSIAIRLKDIDAIHELALNQTNLLLQLKKPSEAILFLSKLVKKYPVVDVNGRIRIMAGFVTIYEMLNQYPLAEDYCDQLLGIAKKTELNDEAQGLVYKALIPFYLATGKYSEVKKYLAPNEKLAQKTGSLMNLSINHLWWFRLDSAQRNYTSAISHYQQYKTLNDSLFNEAKSRHINQLEILYNIEKKDQDLQLKEQNIQLLTKQGQLQQTKLGQANLLKNLTFVGLALLLIIISLLFNRYRIKQRNNEKLEAQQKEISRKNDSLQHLVDEKEWLLKELHHRIKNNLHMVVGLLDTQAGFVKTGEARDAILESQHRVNAMSMVHQKLYQSENLSAIEMVAYIHELVEYLRDAFNTGQRILFNLDIDRVTMNLSHSIPLGLILNEAITNAIKYAFPGNRDGAITISLKNISPGRYDITIADNGVGLPYNFNELKMNSLGMSLMQGLCDDINGAFVISSENGTAIKISFMYDHAAADGLPLHSSEIITTQTQTI